MKNGILKFVPFSEMKETPTAWDTPYTQHLNELKADTEGRSASTFNVRHRYRVKKKGDVPLKYTSFEWLSRRKQALACECCGSQFSAMTEKHGDHNHTTGEWRGVLCMPCNIVVGWVDKYPNISEQVAQYLHSRN